MENLTPEIALEKLKEGNHRFVTGELSNKNIGDARRKELVNGQHPYAIILGCSDSRVPPEVIFDEGLGDIFVVRNAGNIVDNVVLGSIEYAAEHLHVPLIVVLGHDFCGAVSAAVQGGEAPGSIGAILRKINPSVAKAKETGLSGSELVEASADNNIAAAAADIEESGVIHHLIREGKLKVVGAKYFLDTGVVEFR